MPIVYTPAGSIAPSFSGLTFNLITASIYSISALSVHGAPKTPSVPLHHPRWPPVGVRTKVHLGLARIASKGIAALGAMGSSSA